MSILADLITRARHARASLLNSAKLVSGNRFTAPYRSDFTVVKKTAKFSLRHYSHALPPTENPARSHVLLIPPLMVTAEIYDMAPDLFATLYLREQGHDVFGIDFGTPEATQGGLEKTLADHVLAVSEAIDELVARHAAPVHLVGYSQGGMFAYQAAALRRCRDVASIITMGSPVDLLKNLPMKVHTGLLANLVQSAGDFIRKPLESLPGLPGQLTSIGFKLASPGKELKHLLLMLRFLDDEEALKRLEPTRRFLGGEGFIAWPGPALRSFIDDFVVHNRMMSGGFVIAGQTASLSDLSAPVLYFRGRRDTFARPHSIIAVERVVPHDEVYGVEVDVGHLGLVVGAKAKKEVWSTVDAWLRFRDRGAKKPAGLERFSNRTSTKERRSSSFSPIVKVAQRSLFQGMGKLALDATNLSRWLRFQLPRLIKLAQLWDSAPMSVGRTLAEQAKAIPERTFFLWEGRAFSYADANTRVSRIAGALYHAGIRRGQAVGLLMENHPECLTALTALSRLGAIPVLINPGARGTALEHAIAVTGVADVILGPANHELTATFGTRRLLIGRSESGSASGSSAPAPTGALHLDEVRAELPADVPPNPGRATDIAFLMFTSGTTGQPKAVRISNRRWQMAATAAAAGCDLTPNDTVYCCLPLHHGTGMLLSVSGALLGGCRLAIAPKFSTRGFWEDVRRTGTTVVFYVGELCRYLVSAPPSPLEKTHAVRLFVGNGMRAEVWSELLRRFGRVSVLEFYAATEGNVVMTNLTGEKIGSIGRVPFGIVTTKLVEFDPATATFPRDARGFLIPARVNQPGMLLVEIKEGNPLSRFDGYTDAQATEAKILRNVFKKDDAWFNSGDLLREDADGDYWFVDRVGDTFRWKGENVSTEQVAGVLAELPFVEMCAVYGVRLPGQEGRAGMAAITLRPGHFFDGAALFAQVEQHLIDAARPRFVRIVPELITTETMKIVKHGLQNDGIDTRRTGPLYVYDRGQATYVLVDEKELPARIGSL